jgi:iron complex transport system substrate-binding protein
LNVRGGAPDSLVGPAFRIAGRQGFLFLEMRMVGHNREARWVLWLVLVAAVAVSAGCAKPDEIASSVTQVEAAQTIKDDLGREVRMPAKLERAVSLAPSITELIFAAGAGNKLVGVTTYCDFPAEAKSIQKIGDTQTPNVEAIIALKPQVVFVSTASQLEAFAKTLEDQSIAVYVVDVKGVDDVPNVVRQLGSFFGTLQQADANAIALYERMEKARAKDASTTRPRVFVQISDEPLFTIGKDSFLTGLIERAGGESVTKDLPTGYPKLSKETASALGPDVIILSDSGDNQKPNDALRDSPAVKTGRVLKINADILSRTGPRLVDALEMISKRLSESGKSVSGVVKSEE